MQKVTLGFKCNPGMGRALLDNFTVALVDTRVFDGCRSVETFVDQDDPDFVMLVEEWESRPDYERYMAWRVETGLLEMLKPILATPLELHFLDPHPA
jgi:quinol monooxygenase YgiN